VIADAGGEDAAKAQWGENEENLAAASKWKQMRLLIPAVAT
jgi:hypothetical protein